MMAMHVRDIHRALTMRKDAAVMAAPPRKGIVARCRQP